MPLAHQAHNNPVNPAFHLSENIIEAIKSCHSDDWRRLFDSMRFNQIKLIESCPDEDLTKERGKLIMVGELEGLFLQVHRSPNTQERKK